MTWLSRLNNRLGPLTCQPADHGHSRKMLPLGSGAVACVTNNLSLRDPRPEFRDRLHVVCIIRGLVYNKLGFSRITPIHSDLLETGQGRGRRRICHTPHNLHNHLI